MNLFFRTWCCFLVLLNSIVVSAASAPGDKLENLPEVRKVLTQADQSKSVKYQFQYSTPKLANSHKRFVVFLRTEIEDGAPSDSELVVIAVEKVAEKFKASEVFRDVSVMGLRDSTRAGLNEIEMRAVFLEDGRFQMKELGGKENYRRYAQEQLSEQEVSKDQRWVFDQLLGKGWASSGKAKSGKK